MDTFGDEFYVRSRHTRDEQRRAPAPPRPETYKSFPDAKRITLPEPVTDGGPGLWRVIQSRHSIRQYSNDPISLRTLSQLLWACTGRTHVRDNEHRQFRTAPSAGATYPFDTYLIVNRVEELEPGRYHYDVREHALELLAPGTFGEAAAAACMGQKTCATAAVVFAWAATIERTRWRYGERAYRYILIDAGHIQQNLHLAATALGLGCCAIGAFYDDEVNALFAVDAAREPILYLSIVGHPAEAGEGAR